VKPEVIYQALCAAPQLEAAAADLSDKQLRTVYCHLAREGAVSGIPSLVQGVLGAEMVQRFINAGGGR
jgi:hypothetical protein